MGGYNKSFSHFAEIIFPLNSRKSKVISVRNSNGAFEVQQLQLNQTMNWPSKVRLTSEMVHKHTWQSVIAEKEDMTDRPATESPTSSDGRARWDTDTHPDLGNADWSSGYRGKTHHFPKILASDTEEFHFIRALTYRKPSRRARSRTNSHFSSTEPL